jgi:hypothetical protein
MVPWRATEDGFVTEAERKLMSLGNEMIESK